MDVKNGFTVCDERNAFDDEGFFSLTSTEQKRVEDGIRDILKILSIRPLQFHREKHINYVRRLVHELPSGYSSQEASRTWFAFWILHSLRVLDTDVSDSEKKQFVDFIKSCEHPDGGYGGAPGHFPHLATTYAAVMALISIGTDEALASINRPTLLNFYRSLKQSDGSFRMHEDGEVDVRAVYCVASVVTVLGIADEKLFLDTPAWVASCQTYEGGFAGAPGCEAHGGYTFCGAASLVLLNQTSLMNADSLAHWIVMRQMRFEGGFQGRPGKLVDACYSYWVGAAAVVVQKVLEAKHELLEASPKGLFNAPALQAYILGVAQHPSGGLRDKPLKYTDVYHTCYALSGLAIAQALEGEEPPKMLGGENATLAPVNVLLNVAETQAEKAFDYFRRMPLTTGMCE